MAAVSRRTFLQRLTGWMAAVPVLGPLLGCAARATRIGDPERAVLAAATERLLPSNDGPGAREAVVIEYIVRALSTRYHAPKRKLFADGARRLDDIARREWRKPFVELSPEEQDRVLSWVQRGGLDDEGFPGRRFFDALLDLTLEGFLGDPVHGGNRNENGWQFIGYTPGDPRPGSCLGDCEAH